MDVAGRERQRDTERQRVIEADRQRPIDRQMDTEIDFINKNLLLNVGIAFLCTYVPI